MHQGTLKETAEAQRQARSGSAMIVIPIEHLMHVELICIILHRYNDRMQEHEDCKPQSSSGIVMTNHTNTDEQQQAILL